MSGDALSQPDGPSSVAAGPASQLAFLERGGGVVDAANVAIGRRDANLRNIDGEFLMELAERFAPDWEQQDADSETPSPSIYVTGGPHGSVASMPEGSPGTEALAGPGSASFHMQPGPAAPPKEHFARVLIVGPSGSGKTAFREAIAQVIRFQKLDIAPSVHATSTTFHFAVPGTATRSQEKLYIDLVDTGPLQRSGLGRFYRPADLVVLTWSLATVKQVKKRTGLLSVEETAVVHPREVQELANTIRELAVAVPGVPLVVIGTHKDILSERSVSSVAKVVQTLERHVLSAIDAAARGEPTVPLPPSTTNSSQSSPVITPGASPTRSRPNSADAATLAPPLLLGTYAVSCLDNKCVGSGGGEQVSVTSMWRTVCESILKGVRIADPLHGGSLSSLRYFSCPTELSDLVQRVSRFFTCLRTEHGIVLLGVHQLAQAFFAFGVPSTDVVDAVLRLLERRGQLVVLDRTPEHPRQVLLVPNLPSRIVSAVLGVASGMKATIEERVARSKLVSIDDCVTADSSRELNRGVMKRALVKHMAACVPNDVAQDRSLVFVRVARQIHFMFRLTERNPASTSQLSMRNNTAPAAGPNVAASNSNSANLGDTNMSFFSQDSNTSASDKFIVPSLVTATVAPTTIASLRRAMLSGQLHCCARRVSVPLAPTGFISTLQCEVGELVVQRTHVTRTSVWLSCGHSRCFIVANKTPAQLPDPVDVELLFFGATGPDSVREFALFVATVMSHVTRALAVTNVAKLATVIPLRPDSVGASPGSPGRALGGVSPQPGHSPTRAEPPACGKDALVNISDAPREDSVAWILRTDLSVAPLSGS